MALTGLATLPLTLLLRLRQYLQPRLVEEPITQSVPLKMTHLLYLLCSKLRSHILVGPNPRCLLQILILYKADVVSKILCPFILEHYG